MTKGKMKTNVICYGMKFDVCIMCRMAFHCFAVKQGLLNIPVLIYELVYRY